MLIYFIQSIHVYIIIIIIFTIINSQIFPVKLYRANTIQVSFFMSYTPCAKFKYNHPTGLNMWKFFFRKQTRERLLHHRGGHLLRYKRSVTFKYSKLHGSDSYLLFFSLLWSLKGSKTTWQRTLDLRSQRKQRGTVYWHCPYRHDREITNNKLKSWYRQIIFINIKSVLK